MHSFLVGNNEHKKAEGVNENVVVTIGYNEYKDVLLNNKCIRHSMNIIQNQDHRIETYGIKKINCLVLTTKYMSKPMDMVV